METATQAPRKRAIHYPESDGKPMAETDTHRSEMTHAIETLRLYFRDRPMVYVTGNILFYYVEGDPKKRRSPDVMVVNGVPRYYGRVYLLWEDHRAPSFVIEVTSRQTRKVDWEKKYELYARPGGREYVLVDPLDEYMGWAPLQLLRLEGSRYTVVSPEEDGTLLSRELNLKLALIDGRLRGRRASRRGGTSRRRGRRGSRLSVAAPRKRSWSACEPWSSRCRRGQRSACHARDGRTSGHPPDVG